ncbi:putative homeobox-leucine zipper protein ROC8-like [Capsicum annuum]|nr:putative homeobox-leucine zipper protein ROC8-like [Capsicum annuum]
MAESDEKPNQLEESKKEEAAPAAGDGESQELESLEKMVMEELNTDKDKEAIDKAKTAVASLAHGFAQSARGLASKVETWSSVLQKQTSDGTETLPTSDKYVGESSASDANTDNANNHEQASTTTDEKQFLQNHRINNHCFEVVTRSKDNILGQQTHQLPSVPTPIFRFSTPKGVIPHASASEEGINTAESLKKTLALLEHSSSKYSGAKNDDSSTNTSTPLTTHKLITSTINLYNNMCYSPTSSVIMQAVIDKLVDSVDGLIDEEFSHALGKAPEVHEKVDPMKQTSPLRKYKFLPRLSETSAIEMCIHGIHWELFYILQGINPKSFEKLATHVHGMELSMSSVEKGVAPVHNPRKGKDKKDLRRWSKFVPKSENNESINVDLSPIKFTIKVIPFGLKNTSDTYQRAIQNIFDGLTHKNIECYVDDLVIKSWPPEVLHPTIVSWPFNTWGLDVIKPLLKSSGGHLYILATTDYFSKWAKDVAHKEVKKKNIINFIQVNIIYHFKISQYIITNNRKPFDTNLMNKICDLFGFKQHKSSMYHAIVNGLSEAFNKTLCNLLKKVISKSKRDWHKKMEEALWAYRITYRTSTQDTPYSLAFGIKEVLPLEHQIPFLRLAIQEGLTEEENTKLHFAELESLNEKRLEALQNLKYYQARLSCSFNKRVHLSFQIHHIEACKFIKSVEHIGGIGSAPDPQSFSTSVLERLLIRILTHSEGVPLSSFGTPPTPSMVPPSMPKSSDSDLLTIIASILGIDWLAPYHAILDCHAKTMTLASPGRTVTKKGIMVDPSKTAAIRDWARPTLPIEI